MQVDLTATEIRLLADLVSQLETHLQARRPSAHHACGGVASDGSAAWAAAYQEIGHQDTVHQDTVHQDKALLLSLLADIRGKLSCAQWLTLTCSFCGTQFVSPDPASRFCSDRCRRRFERMTAQAIRNIPAPGSL